MIVQMVQVAPATVPGPQVTRVWQQEPELPALLSAQPRAVPPASAIRVLPEQLTAEQVAQLRAENEALRHELARLRAG